MKKSRTKLLLSLRQLHQERQRLIRRLTREHELAIGTVSVVRRKCGNPRCHCIKGSGHPQTLFLFKDEKENRRRCKLVRRSDEPRMIRAGVRYREFREDLKRLRAIDLGEKQILMALAEERAIHYE
jgi:hypothetical protein